MKTRGGLDTYVSEKTEEGGTKLRIEDLEEIFDEVHQYHPDGDHLTPEEYAAFKRAGFVSTTRGNRWIIYVDKERVS